MQTALFTKVLSERPLREAFEIAADLGYDAVELMGRDPHLDVETSLAEADALRDHADDLGLEIAAIASYTGGYADADDDACEAALTDFERFCDLAEVLSVDYIRQVVGGPSPWRADQHHYERAAAWLDRAATIAASSDVEVGVEIHCDSIVESASDATTLLDLIDRENVSVIHDAGNMFISDESYGPESIATLGDDLGHVHVKDIRREIEETTETFEMTTRHGEESFSFARLGEGDIDHWQLLRALAVSGYDGYVTDECHAPPNGDDGDVEIAAHERRELDRLIETAERASRRDARLGCDAGTDR